MAQLNNPSTNLAKLTLNLLARFFAKRFRSVYYSAKESVGEHKRDIVVYQVNQACISLQDTRNEFEDALERFKNIVAVSESTLEHRYHLLNRQYQFCRSKADMVSTRIKAIEEVSEALFVEWENELNEYSNRVLKNNSKQQLKASKQQYLRLIKTMRRAESKIHPVLAAFKDQVLYLKHNLNARAIAALQHEFIEMSLDISQLIEAMELTIAEANEFVASLVQPQMLKTKTLLIR